MERSWLNGRVAYYAVGLRCDIAFQDLGWIKHKNWLWKITHAVLEKLHTAESGFTTLGIENMCIDPCICLIAEESP